MVAWTRDGPIVLRGVSVADGSALKAGLVVSVNSTILRDAVGALWMATAGTVAALGVAAMVSTHLTAAVVLIAVTAVVALVLYPIGISMLRAALRLPRPQSLQITAERKKLSRRFGVVVGIEMAFFALANVVLLLTNRYEYLVPAILLITGVHFIPIARLYRMWPYYLTGLLFCLAAVLPVLITSSTTRLGLVSAWIVLPTLSCAVIAWLTAGCVLAIQNKRWIELRAPAATTVEPTA